MRLLFKRRSGRRNLQEKVKRNVTYYPTLPNNIRTPATGPHAADNN